MSNTGRPSLGNTSLYGASSFALGGGSTMIETLQASLKQKDGENHQLQWELSRLQSERNFLLAEVSSLNVQLENVCQLHVSCRNRHFTNSLFFDIFS